MAALIGLGLTVIVLLGCFAVLAHDLVTQDRERGMTHTQVVVALGYEKGMHR